MEKHPVLYSYRRCPYAMRTRMAIFLSGIQVEQREIVFWDKPKPMLDVSPKGTVPVLVLPDGTVIDESRDIMLWAFKHSADKSTYQAWLFSKNSRQRQAVNDWIDRCDNEFKQHLDHYKYADRFPEYSQVYYRELGCEFLDAIESSLSLVEPGNHSEGFALVGHQISMADIALFPFVRQFANVDKNWFSEADYPRLKSWLETFIESDFFKAVMKNRPVWQANHNPLWLNEPGLATKNEFTNKAIAQ
ncbi:glutathione S-transferase [Thiomicrorhabdus sp. Kp2]|uniref:glutathione S-transferase n=1 Tax=Thiomicrorhabdus sp. Kp2 TaxID=1123518 RepID=UPI000594A6A2|nr:glutathione S-transferase [Thiomicrorhabdus sp. Kp2]